MQVIIFISSLQIYVGGLGNNVSKYELEDIFNRYGKLKNVWVARNPPGFAFVEFEDERDAEDAVKALDGTRIGGQKAVVGGSTSIHRSNAPSLNVSTSNYT